MGYVMNKLQRFILNMVVPDWTRPELVGGGSSAMTLSGQRVTESGAMKIATYFRCLNQLTHDLSMVPLQLYKKNSSEDIQRIMPDPLSWNLPYSVEFRPNPYQVPFQLRERFWKSVIVHGNGYLWNPAGTRYLYNLQAFCTEAVMHDDGSVWYITALNGGLVKEIPAVEVKNVLINSKTVFKGSGVLEHARETIGIRQAGNNTKSSMFKRGLMPSAIAEFEGDMSKPAREKVRESYWEAVGGADEAGGVIVLDGKVKKFTLAEIKPADAQFLESIEATDNDILNFFGMPAYKINMGKQSYESNDQQDEDYMRSTLDPYLVQDEQASNVAWIPRFDQVKTYWKYNRDAFLRMNSKARAAYLKDKIFSGQYTPNQALAVDDLPGYPEGNVRYVPSNMAVIKDGAITAISKDTSPQQSTQDGSNNQ